MTDLPPLRALSVFTLVGRFGSMSKAAYELGISPGAVSQQVKLLESALDIQLVSRKAAGIVLTEAGRAYHEAISPAFDNLRASHNDFLARFRGNLTVSALPLLASKWLASRLFEWQAKHPSVTVHLQSTIREDRSDAAPVDFRITYECRATHFDRSSTLFADSLIPVCSPRLLEDGPALDDPLDLLNYQLLTVDWKALVAPAPTWQDWFALNGYRNVAVKKAFVFSASSLAIEAAVCGRGVALIQAMMIADELRNGQLVAPFPLHLRLPTPYVVAWNDSALDKQGAPEFHRWILSAAREAERAAQHC